MVVSDGIVEVDPRTKQVYLEVAYLPAPLVVKQRDPGKPQDERHDIAGWKYRGCTCEEWCNYGCPLWDIHYKERKAKAVTALENRRRDQEAPRILVP